MKKVCPKRTPQSPFICSLLLCLSCTTCVLIFFELTRFFTNFFLSFVSLHRCSIFKDRSFAASQSLAHSLYIISHSPAFVKTFLQSFSSFFRRLFRPLPRFPVLSCQTLSDATLLFYHISSVLSSAFSKFLIDFFSTLLTRILPAARVTVAFEKVT